MPAVRPKLPNNGRCYHCQSAMLYHDYDPAHRHNGYTCGACGREQILSNGTTSLIKSTKG